MRVEAEAVVSQVVDEVMLWCTGARINPQLARADMVPAMAAGTLRKWRSVKGMEAPLHRAPTEKWRPRTKEEEKEKQRANTR